MNMSQIVSLILFKHNIHVYKLVCLDDLYVPTLNNLHISRMHVVS